MTVESEQAGGVERGRIDLAAVTLGRRRLLRGSLGAAPVLMTLISGPVSAKLCIAGSAFASLHASGKQATLTCNGRSPADWTAFTGTWPINRNTQFNTIFGSQLGTNIKFDTLLALTNYSADPRLEVAQHLAAAHLNAAPTSTFNTAIVLSQVIAREIWTQYAANASGLGTYRPTAAIEWNKTQIITWIKTTYA